MKKITYIIVFASCLLVSCHKDQGTKNTMPSRLSIDIPDNLSNATANRSVEQGLQMDAADTYENIREFVAVAESAADLVDAIASSLQEHKIDRVMEFSFTGDDNRDKKLTVEENKYLDNKAWGLKLTIVDKELNDTAIQVYWNKGQMAGVAILQPYHMNRQESDVNAIYKIDYSELESAYQARMIVELIISAQEGTWSMNKMKLFAGRNGDDFVLYGNSNHPNASETFFSYDQGASYAFIAKSNVAQDIAVAEIALAPAQMLSVDSLLKAYSIENVLKREVIRQMHDDGHVDTTNFSAQDWDYYYALLEEEIINMGAPAYFDSKGFIAAGDTILEGFTTEFKNMEGLNPFAPSLVKDLNIRFE